MNLLKFDLRGKTIVLTGATHGIGRATAAGLADAGADMVLACRDTDAAEHAAEELASSTGNSSIVVVHLDLSSLTSVRAAAEEIRGLRSRIDVLINNAGTFSMKRRLTVDGFEMTMGVNHLGHFLLTHELMPLLKGSTEGRIVNLASDAHLHGKIDFDDFFMERRYAGFRAYAASRLATVLFTQELAERLRSQASAVAVNSVHPGHVATNIWNLWPTRKLVSHVLQRVMSRFLLSPEEGAATSLYLAGSRDVTGVSGRYFADCREAESNPLCEDAALRTRLWDLSATLTGSG